METQELVEPVSHPAAVPPRLRWYQFRLRSLLIVMVVCALASSGWVVHSERARRKQEQDEAARFLKGIYSYASFEADSDGNIVGFDIVTETIDGRVAALRRIHYLRSVKISAWSINDEGLMALSKLGPLQHVELKGIGGTDFALLGKIGTLYVLKCQAPESVVTDGRVSHLGRLKDLQTLELDFHFTTDLAWLAELKQLESLRLTNAELTESARIRFAALPNLREAELRHCYVCNGHLSELGSAPRLRRLDLSVTRLTDAGLLYLRGLTGLEKLDLQGTGITDAGLQYIAALPSLKEVDVTRTPVTRAGVNRLRTQRPDLKVKD